MTITNDNIHVLSRAVIVDQNNILLCKTLDLPVNFYFLPGGHVEHGESAENALVRELLEEAGAQVQIKRFLGVLEHSFEPGRNSICHNHEYNLVFEAGSESLTINHIIPKLEDRIELVWVPLAHITEIDFRAEPFRTLIPEWLKADQNNSFKTVMSEPCVRR
jgi:ADP-ribose pyrophosphatase YjhB (NUDIX family)